MPAKWNQRQREPCNASLRWPDRSQRAESFMPTLQLGLDSGRAQNVFILHPRTSAAPPRLSRSLRWRRRRVVKGKVAAFAINEASGDFTGKSERLKERAKRPARLRQAGLTEDEWTAEEGRNV